MSGIAPIWIAAWLAISPAREPTLELEADGLDADAVESGLRARVGEELDDWSIRVEREAETQYRVWLRQGRGARDQRVVTLSGLTEEDRSRELAATIALILDAPPEQAKASTPSTPLELPTGFVAIDGQVQLGPPRDLDPSFGIGLTGGAWLLGEHLQPRARVGWSHSWSGSLDVHQVAIGLGLAAGAPVGRWWCGVLVMPSVNWTRASQIRTSTIWTGGGEASLVGQYRRRHFVVGLRTGVEANFPSLRIPGTQEVIRWGPVRWLGVLEVGFGI